MRDFFLYFVRLNRSASRAINGLLPEKVRRDGNHHFLNDTLSDILHEGAVVYDLGGGAQPFVSRELKKLWSLRLVGLDICEDELQKAPPGIYDETIVADLCSFKGNAEADIVICQATLEHVKQTRGAIEAIASILKPGGKAYLFAPCRNAVFARLNLILPQRLKEKLLFALLPETEESQGFPAHYNEGTPKRLERLFAQNNLRVVKRELFWMSSYFMVFLPLFLVWRAWQLLFYLVARHNAAETMIYVVERE